MHACDAWAPAGRGKLFPRGRRPDGGVLTREKARFFSWRTLEWAAWFVVWLGLLGVTIAGYFGREDWRLDLFANFRMQYYLAALLLCAAVAWRRFRVLLALFLVPLLWNGWEIFNIPPRRDPASQDTVYRAISANVFTKNAQPEHTEEWIRAQEPDVVALIEITDRWDDTLKRLKDILPYQRRQGWGPRYGSALLSRHPPAADPKPGGYAGVGSLPLAVQTPDGPLICLLVHPVAPTTERAWKWRGNALEAIAEYAAEESRRAPMLVLGDFNTTPWSPFHQDFLSRSGLDPVETSVLPRRTWPTHNPLFWIPIDHFFLSPQLAAQKQWVGPNLGSDHYPIALDFTFRSAENDP